MLDGGTSHINSFADSTFSIHFISFCRIVVMQTSISVGISLPRKIMKRIDVERGDVSRSRYLLRLLETVYVPNENVCDLGQRRTADLLPEVEKRSRGAVDGWE